ncbi:hypothetical protein [Roseinatronobacter alkalisoli]|uniref:Uncharacterized protein n=1 Tax=Roseinatronobacter alkalisoli TaxID=3028235 RepID=A0ABT5TA25_9RHOB|nr:hypothetical protein [Roseinatronobacter sp. HJB301]MDD7971585.1 hypothetical protein [Roseinatronobacter sp. HJB301]
MLPDIAQRIVGLAATGAHDAQARGSDRMIGNSAARFHNQMRQEHGNDAAA